MSIVTIVYELEGRLTQPGCPICQVSGHAARQYVKVLLWQLINDPSTLQAFQSDWGYCPAHTLMVAQMEQEMFKDCFGTDVLFESLSRHVKDQLTRPSIMRPWQSIWRKIASVVRPWFEANRSNDYAARCVICDTAESSAEHALSGLIESLQLQPDKWQLLYLKSDGLRLAHLRETLSLYKKNFPSAVQFVLEHRLKLLGAQADAMQNYARKYSWDRRSEEKTEEELHAWEHNLAFFSGYPASMFFTQAPASAYDYDRASH